MKIGILCYPTSGGSGVVACELGAALASRGHDVHVLSYRLPFRMRPVPDRFHFHEIRIPQYPLFEFPSYGMAAASALAEVARRHRLDIFHAHYAFPHGVSAFLAKEMLGGDPPAKSVTTLHGTDVSLVESDGALNDATKLGIVRSDAVTAVSEALRKRTAAWFGLSMPIEVIPNFVDTARFRPKPRGPRRERVVVHVSNFRPVKRSADAVRAFYLLRRRAEAKLWLLGDGPEAAAVRDLAEKLGVADDVVLLGEDREIQEVLPEADVLLSTSEFEGFGLAPLEAMACGVPVVASNTGGLPEVVADGVTGRLAPVGDVEAFAEGMLELFDRPDMGVAARQRAVDRFDTSLVVPRYEALYERTLAGGERSVGHA